MPKLNFSYNWNNKLGCKFFTTIRLSNDYNNDTFDSGVIVDVYENKVYKFQAEVVNVRRSPLSFIDTEILVCDVGYSRKEFYEIVRKMYQIQPYELDDTVFLIITLRKI